MLQLNIESQESESDDDEISSLDSIVKKPKFLSAVSRQILYPDDT